MMFLFRGAESVISADGKTVVKERVRKPYRIEELDMKIIKFRTKREAKILRKLNSLGIAAPKLIKTYDNIIVMERIDGIPLKEKIESDKNPEMLFHQMGVLVSELHLANVIHGDLTTSNFMSDGNKVYVIDFGLSYISPKDEDKAVDLYVFERAIGCAHDAKHLEDFYSGYELKEKESIEKKLNSVRLRGRKREESALG